MSNMRFRVRLDGATRAARKVEHGRHVVDEIAARRMQELQEFAVVRVYRRLALRDTGHMARGIHADQTGRLSFQVIVEAVDPDSGFNYAPVTRFGHETELIEPVSKKALHWITKGTVVSGAPFRVESTPFKLEGHEVFSSWSRGFHPERDWAERGHPVVRRAASRIGKLIASEVALEMSRGR